MEKKFGELVQDVQSHKTPGTPKFLIMMPMVEIEKMSAEHQTDYQLSIAMLLYLMKHSPPNLVNKTRVLSKVNDGANPVAYKELLCVIRYVLDTNSLGLQIGPMENSNEPWEIFVLAIVTMQETW